MFRKTVAVLLVAALAVPTVALASNGRGGSMGMKGAKQSQKASQAASRKDGKQGMGSKSSVWQSKFSARVMKHAGVRRAVYGRIAARLQAGIDRVRAIASEATSGGIDTSGVVAELDQAQAALDLAKARAASIDASLTAIAGAPDRETAREMLHEAGGNGLAVGRVFADARDHLNRAIEALLALTAVPEQPSEPATPPAEVPTDTVPAG